MEMEDFLDDDMFDLKPILPEMYSSSSSSSLLVQQLHHPQQTPITHPSYETTYGTTSRIANQNLGSQTASFNASESAASSSDLAARSSKLFSFKSTVYDNSNTNFGGGYGNRTSTSDAMVKPQIINFSSMVEDDFTNFEYDNLEEGSTGQARRSVTVNRTPLQAQDHVLAERKRRQKLGQLFITLSKVVPGLKKLDKASLLEDAIDHLKSLQERVNVLEEAKLKRSSSSSPSSSNDDSSLVSITNIDDDEDMMGNGMTSDQSPEIKAMISNGSTVLIKVCCRNQKGLMSRIPWELEKMHLTVTDIRIMPFGDVTLVITILAQLRKEFRGTVKDIIEQLEMVFLNPPA